MGRIFLNHPGGITLYSCANCDTALTNRSELTSMLTGRHMVRDVFCKNCNSKLGWMYEYATEESQQYKVQLMLLNLKLLDFKIRSFPTQPTLYLTVFN
ncbi:hypothetical protein pdam_00007812, partial [Pocillopora damicornis]